MVWEAGRYDIGELISFDLETWKSCPGDILYCALIEKFSVLMKNGGATKIAVFCWMEECSPWNNG